MKYVFVFILSIIITDPTKIGKINSLKADAKKLFNGGKYDEAIKKYRYLVDTLDVTEDEVKLNLASAYFLTRDTSNARTAYQELAQNTKPAIRSTALQQLGVLNNQQGKAEEALSQFKQAIKADPTNTDARYNYEMLKKKLDDQKKKDEQNKDKNKDQKEKDKKDEQKKNEKEQEKKDQEKKDQEKKDQEKKEQEKKEQEQKDQQKKDEQNKSEQEKKEEQEKKDQEKTEQQKEEDQRKKEQKPSPEVAKKLKEMNMSPEKANMILEAMKNQEIQYLQQNKRKATKSKDKSKPDW